MRSNLFNYVLFAVLSAGMIGLYLYAEQNWLPKPEPKAENAKGPEAKDPKDAQAKSAEPKGPEAKDAEPKPAPPPPPPPVAKAPPTPSTLVALGGDGFYNRALLSTRGGGVQQVVLPEFNEADRLGKERKNGEGQGLPLALIPGNVRFRPYYLADNGPYPDLKPGKVTRMEELAEPSYTMFHYASVSGEDHWPLPDLGEREWTLVSENRPADGPHSVVFETTLDAPYFLTIRKTYSLAAKDYHIGLKIEIRREKSDVKGKPFRYQLTGAHGLPIEGEWYSPTFRTALFGWRDSRGNLLRSDTEDAATIANKRGGDSLSSNNRAFLYAAVTTQYFASALAIDDTVNPEESKKWWAYVRATTESPTPEQVKEAIALAEKNPGDFDLKRRADQFRVGTKQPQFEDITVRAVAEPIELEPGQSVTHSYLLYNGPAKVSQLALLSGNRDVDSQLVDRYMNKLGLKTITDYRSSSFMGRFANAIYWTDLVIFFTNLMHNLLAGIHYVLASIGLGTVSWGLSIICLTVMVRILLFIPSRKQTQSNMRMVEIQNRLKPDLEKLHEKYKDDFQAYNREKTALLMKNGLNPFTMMSGCLLIFAQMPVFMGLYFCLQESIFFRLEPFLWISNLAAPDMTIWWGENIPVLSTPDSLGGFLYLGPYFNVLPLMAVALMMWQQSKMMPPATDEMAQQQRMMMKVMLGMMALFFYKSPAGLCIYFIATTIWGIIERQVIPKPKIGPVAHDTSVIPAAPPKPKGWIGRKKEELRAKLEELQKQAEAQASRQARNDRGPAPRRDTDRKKKRRK